MGLAFGPWLGIVRTRPAGMADGCAGPCHAGLSEALRALEAPVDPPRVPATFGDWRHARILLEVGGGRRAVAWCAQGHEETWGEDRAGAWARTHEGAGGRGRGQVRHGVVAVLDRLHGGTELRHQGPDQADVGREDACRGRERHGRLNRRKALSDAAGLHLVLAKEALQGGTAGQMNGFAGRPLAEKLAADGRVLVGEPAQDLRDIVFQGAREAIGQTDLGLHQAPAACHELVQRAPRGAWRRQPLECIAVFAEPFELEFRSRGGIRRPTRRAGGAVCGHRQRVDGAQHPKVMGT
jgi:hypothetical protein